MDKTVCYNLCDQLQDYEKILHRKTERIYAGSYFCTQYMINQPMQRWEEIFRICCRDGIKVTLVLPIVTEKNAQLMKHRIQEILILGHECIDEMCVNDYGMLDFAVQEYTLPIHLGRLFFKDYRDPRYEEYRKITCRPKLFNSYFMRIIEKYKIHGIEFDPIVDCIDLGHAFPGLVYSIHTPYCYITTGQICEYGSVSLAPDQKFRPNGSCNMECVNYSSQYEISDGQIWYRKGRAVFFRNEQCSVIGIDKIREIVSVSETDGQLKENGTGTMEQEREAL